MTALEVLKQYWGYDSFRPLQADIVEAVAQKKDVLALLPTGGGKSLCFQVPSLMGEGIGLVISPLIALMKDQVYNLKKRGIKAEAIFSGMHHKEIDHALDRCIYGSVKLLYVSPERLRTEIFQERLKKMKVRLVAIDEAHCISQWGYDFRPAYLQIATIKEYLPDVPFIALTATATEMVKKDIVEKLELKDATIFQKSFERKNVSYSVLYTEDKAGKLLHILKKVPGTGIVYVRNRKQTQEIAYFLHKNGIKANFYHGGLKTDERSKKQEAWINNHIRVMVCTNAFGMGIDKPDVRVVVHLGLPESIEAYFQEAGRAGRDEKKAYAVLLYHPADGINLIQQFKRNMPDIPTIKTIYHALGNYFRLAYGAGIGQRFDFDLVTFCENFNMRAVQVYHALQTLEREEYFALTEGFVIPSKIRFKVNRHQLYDFQVRHLPFNSIVKVLLRSYEGVMDDFAKINEEQLAKQLSVAITDVIAMLKKLEQYDILQYLPRTDKPQITYLKERFAKEHLSLDVKRFNFRRKVMEDNLKAVVRYGEVKHVCRSQQLLAYFGEKETTKCGMCDVCLNRNKVTVTVNESENIELAIQYALANRCCSFEELVAAVQAPADKVIEVVRQMIAEGLIVVDEREELVFVV